MNATSLLLAAVLSQASAPVAPTPEPERVVLVPAAAGKLALQEAKRLTPWARFETYQGDAVEQGPDQVAVLFTNRRATGVFAGAVGIALYDRGLVLVFMRDLEDALGKNRGDPMFKVALGRVVAHELEHVRRGKPGHDETGYFAACPTRDNMLTLGWGR